VSGYPDAAVHGAPGLAAKRPNLRFDHVLDDEAPAEWRGDIEQHVFRGAPSLNEVVFLHRRTRTLVLTDLAFNVPPDGMSGARVFYWVVGAAGRFGPHRMVRAFIGDRRAARESVDRLLRWDFDRVIVSHGDVLETGGRDRLAHGFAFL
jgi:hypothetical protein